MATYRGKYPKRINMVCGSWNGDRKICFIKLNDGTKLLLTATELNLQYPKCSTELSADLSAKGEQRYQEFLQSKVQPNRLQQIEARLAAKRAIYEFDAEYDLLNTERLNILHPARLTSEQREKLSEIRAILRQQRRFFAEMNRRRHAWGEAYRAEAEQWLRDTITRRRASLQQLRYAMQMEGA